MKWATTRLSLIERLRDPGDTDAWGRFERSYGELILRYACRRGLSLEDAEDVRQNVFVSMFGVLRRFELRPERGRFRSYLGRVVGNAIQRHRARTRARSGFEVLEPDLVPFATAAGPHELDALWEREWTDDHLRRALATVRRSTEPASLDVFERLLSGRSVEDVARATDRSVEAVRKIRQRVRGRLQVEIRRQLEEEAVWLSACNPGRTP